VITEPISTTNMTGMWIIIRGSSFLTAPMAARRKIAGSKSAAAPRKRTFGGRGATASARDGESAGLVIAARRSCR
jgi:hypothetical protein